MSDVFHVTRYFKVSRHNVIVLFVKRHEGDIVEDYRIIYYVNGEFACFLNRHGCYKKDFHKAIEFMFGKKPDDSRLYRCFKDNHVYFHRYVERDDSSVPYCLQDNDTGICTGLKEVI